MELDVVEEVGVAGAEEEAAELIAGGATDAFAPPDRADGMLTAILLVAHFDQHLVQILRSGAQGLLHRGHLGLGQRVVQVIAEHLPGDRGHADSLAELPKAYTGSMTPHQAFAAGKLDEAVEMQESLVAERPGEVSPRVALVELLLFTGRLDELRSHLAIISSDDPAWPDTARMFRQIVRSERRRSHRIRRPIAVPEPVPAHAKARWLAIRSLREGEPERAVKWIDRADTKSPAVRGFLNGIEFSELRDADDRFASVLEAFVDGQYVWFPWEAVSRVKLEPVRFAMDRFARFAAIRLKDGTELNVHLPLLYPGSYEAADEFAVGLETDETCPDGGPVRCIGGKLLIVDDEERPLDEVTMIEVR